MSPEEQKLEKLAKLMELSQIDTLTPKELEQFLSSIVEAIKNFKGNFDSLSSQKLDQFQELVNQAENGQSQTLKQVRDAIAECRNIAQEVLATKPQDGKSPDPHEIALEAAQIVEERVKPLLPKIEDIKNDLPQLGGSIRDGLELLQGDERLDKSAIKGLDEWQKMIETKSTTSRAPVMLGGAIGRDIIKRYDLPVDGLTSTFVLPAFWYIVDVRSSSSPIAFKYGTDWTNDSVSITFTSEINPATTLAADQTVYIIYVTA